MEAARLHRARERRQNGLTLVEGPDLLADVIAAGGNVRETFALEATDDGVVLVDQRALERLAGTKTPRGPVAVVEIPTDSLDPSRNLLVSVGVSDPGNVGSVIRTAYALVGGSVVLGPGCADPYSPKAVRASMGAIQNRLEQTISRLELTSENLQAAESRIRDADMASEMIDLTKNQILQQSGTAMLAQANQAPQSILQLLG